MAPLSLYTTTARHQARHNIAARQEHTRGDPGPQSRDLSRDRPRTRRWRRRPVNAGSRASGYAVGARAPGSGGGTYDGDRPREHHDRAPRGPRTSRAAEPDRLPPSGGDDPRPPPGRDGTAGARSERHPPGGQRGVGCPDADPAEGRRAPPGGGPPERQRGTAVPPGPDAARRPLRARSAGGPLVPERRRLYSGTPC